MCGSLYLSDVINWQFLMNFAVKTFNELSVNELYEVLKLRSEVFVIEQNCNYQDMDDKDKVALHVMSFDGLELVAYARILAPGISYKEASIGRVIVNKNFRGKDCGRELMKVCIDKTLSQFKVNQIVISAQYYLLKFYRELGFVEEGDIYPEDDIPHIKMRLTN